MLTLHSNSGEIRRDLPLLLILRAKVKIDGEIKVWSINSSLSIQNILVNLGVIYNTVYESCTVKVFVLTAQGDGKSMFLYEVARKGYSFFDAYVWFFVPILMYVNKTETFFFYRYACANGNVVMINCTIFQYWNRTIQISNLS